ncbi:MAG TPA: AraC family transcriptional regulator [Gemmatimonadota bacterium]|nr:AraC family transcriptional regulator [Gemmatimonadota bacterium]
MAAPRPKAPHDGAPRFHALDVDGFRVTEAWFPAGLFLPPHVHERAVFAIFLDGGMDVSFSAAARSFSCAPSTVLIEPPGVRHTQRFGNSDAHLVVVGPDPERKDLTRPCRPLVDEISVFPHGVIATMARRIVRELKSADPVAPLAIEAIVLEMLAAAARLDERERRPAPPADFLRLAQEVIHDRFRERLRIADIATESGVHPVRLARTFRARFHISIGEYIRRLRLEWAAERLLHPDENISGVALSAGFSDQSHFTRAFKRHTGVTPGEFRDWHSRARQSRAVG